ncbi:unnamed protein product [Rhizophagus irregularis]|nr:unnamed protein product [Rhizophagus irregularis]
MIFFHRDEFGVVYRANWIDGYISTFRNWDDVKQNWKRNNLNMFVNLKSLITPNDLTYDLANKIKIKYEFYGMTQDPETKNYMLVLNNKCKKCNKICNAIHFQHKFIDWTSGNDDIDKFIQDTQLSAHNDVREALEWMPYDRLYNLKYIVKHEFGKIYIANWIDGEIICWDYKSQNWERKNQNISVILENLNYSNNITSEFMKMINKACGITQDLETKSYMMVLHRNECKMCNKICNAIHFQQKFIYWTSGNDHIDKFIQDTQLSAHDDLRGVLEWISYDRFYDIKYISKDKFGEVYRANWSDGNINQNWKRNSIDMFVNLKSLNTPNDLTYDLANKIKIEYEFYGMTQSPETKNYMMVLVNKCKKCNKVCNAIHFQHRFIDWTSGNDDIDRFIQDTQLSSAHNDTMEVLEWIPHDRLYDIKYIEKDKFGFKVYKANWIDGNIKYWDNINQNLIRSNLNMFVNLKSLNSTNDLTFELANKIKIERIFYGMTFDPETKII